MDIQQILARLQADRNRLDQAIAALEDQPKRGRHAKPVRRPMSAAARKRIAEAKRKWWAKQKKAKKRR